jgi:hypothetical protein
MQMRGEHSTLLRREAVKPSCTDRERVIDPIFKMKISLLLAFMTCVFSSEKMIAAKCFSSEAMKLERVFLKGILIFF